MKWLTDHREALQKPVRKKMRASGRALKARLPEIVAPPPCPEDLADFIKIYYSPRARKLALRLDVKARIFKLIVPRGVSDRRAFMFARQHLEWMKDKLSALPARIEIGHGAILPLFGEDVRVDISYDTDIRRTSMAIENRVLRVETNLDDVRPRILRFLKNEAKAQLTALSKEKAARIDKSIQSVSVRDTTSRWGSCSYDGKLSYSWRLIFAPYETFDYVVAHEVAHLEHLDHSKAFWGVCRALSEDYVAGKYWICNHGNMLMRYC